MDIVLKNWPVIAVVLLAVANWGFSLPDGPVSRQNYFDLLRQMMLVLGAGAFARQPDALRNVMNRATGRPEEPVLPDDVKKLLVVADKAVAKVEASDISTDKGKKNQAVELVKRTGTGTGAGEPVSDHAANLAVELAVTKRIGTGDGGK